MKPIRWHHLIAAWITSRIAHARRHSEDGNISQETVYIALMIVAVVVIVGIISGGAESLAKSMFTGIKK